MTKILMYISLGVEGFAAVMQIVTMLKAPGLLTVDSAWAVVQPLLLEVSMMAGISINMTTAKVIVGDAVTTILTAHPPKAVA